MMSLSKIMQSVTTTAIGSLMLASSASANTVKHDTINRHGSNIEIKCRSAKAINSISPALVRRLIVSKYTERSKRNRSRGTISGANDSEFERHVSGIVKSGLPKGCVVKTWENQARPRKATGNFIKTYRATVPRGGSIQQLRVR